MLETDIVKKYQDACKLAEKHKFEVIFCDGLFVIRATPDNLVFVEKVPLYKKQHIAEILSFLQGFGMRKQNFIDEDKKILVIGSNMLEINVLIEKMVGMGYQRIRFIQIKYPEFLFTMKGLQDCYYIMVGKPNPYILEEIETELQIGKHKELILDETIN